MNKPNALNPGASSTAAAIDPSVTADPSAGQAYENSEPGAVGNAPGRHKAPEGARVEAGMMSTSKTKAEAGVPDVKPKESGKSA